MPQVLLVEDDPQVRTVIQAALAERGLTVCAAESDKAAQRLLEQGAGQFAVLVADIHLGAGITGFEVARRARRLNPRIEVVYITGKALEADKLGVDGGVLFPKPFNLDDLGLMVETLARGAD